MVNALNYMLKSILDIDKQARIKKEKALSYRKEIYDNIEAEKKEIINTEMETARQKVKTVEKSFKKGIEKRIKDLKAENEKKLKELNKKQQDNQQRWVDELYTRVLSDN